MPKQLTTKKETIREVVNSIVEAGIEDDNKTFHVTSLMGTRTVPDENHSFIRMKQSNGVKVDIIIIHNHHLTDAIQSIVSELESNIEQVINWP